MPSDRVLQMMGLHDARLRDLIRQREQCQRRMFSIDMQLSRWGSARVRDMEWQMLMEEAQLLAEGADPLGSGHSPMREPAMKSGADVGSAEDTSTHLIRGAASNASNDPSPHNARWDGNSSPHFCSACGAPITMRLDAWVHPNRSQGASDV